MPDTTNAEYLLRQFVADYDGKTKSGVEAALLDWSKRELVEIERCGLGKPAQEIEGEDLDGEPIKLSGYKGKVILIDHTGIIRHTFLRGKHLDNALDALVVEAEEARNEGN